MAWMEYQARPLVTPDEGGAQIPRQVPSALEGRKLPSSAGLVLNHAPKSPGQL